MINKNENFIGEYTKIQNEKESEQNAFEIYPNLNYENNMSTFKKNDIIIKKKESLNSNCIEILDQDEKHKFLKENPREKVSDNDNNVNSKEFILINNYFNFLFKF